MMVSAWAWTLMANLQADVRVESVRGELARQDRSALGMRFRDAAAGDLVLAMARDRGGLAKIRYDEGPAPRGWPSGRWGVFSAHQSVQQFHDVVVRIEGDGRFGAEVDELEAARHARVRESAAVVHLDPAKRVIRIAAQVDFERFTDRAPLFRLSPKFELKSGSGCRRIGGLLIYEGEPTSRLQLRYEGRFDGKEEDYLSDEVGYLTYGWLPDTSRTPYPTRVSVIGPRNWELRSEGESGSERALTGDWQADLEPDAREKIEHFRCELPISFPKVMGGSFQKVAEKAHLGKTLAVWHLTPDAERGARTLSAMATALTDLTRDFGPWPFSGYECFEGRNFYGIESYSYTILAPSIETRYVAHEMGHTYFGGLVPCGYVADTWNEGITTYVDDVLTGRNVDRPLANALKTLNYRVPLSQMRRAWEAGNASYARGAAVIKMLEPEIGKEAVIAGLKELVRTRRGKPTTWADLRPAFEQASKRDLAWFWRQWVESASFPTVRCVEWDQAKGNAGFRAKVTLGQTGTPEPYRIRLRVIFQRGASEESRVIEMNQATQQFELDGLESPPAQIRLDAEGFALVRIIDAPTTK